MAVKRISIYLKGTEEFVIWYPKWKDISLIYWVGFIDDRRSVVRSTFYLG